MFVLHSGLIAEGYRSHCGRKYKINEGREGKTDLFTCKRDQKLGAADILRMQLTE